MVDAGDGAERITSGGLGPGLALALVVALCRDEAGRGRQRQDVIQTHGKFGGGLMPWSDGWLTFHLNLGNPGLLFSSLALSTASPRLAWTPPSLSRSAALLAIPVQTCQCNIGA